MKIMVNPEETAADDPWLFYREPPHWRWISYTAAAERLSVYRRQLAALEKCSHIAFPSRPSVSEMLVDLAIRLSGRYSVPVDTGLGAVRVAEEAERRGAGAWIDSRGLGGLRGPPDMRSVVLADEARDPLSSESGGELVERDGGYVVVEEDGGADPGRPGWLEIGDKHSRRIAGELERGLGSSQKRDIVLHWRPLDVAGERYLVEWAIRVAAGIVLVPERSSMAATAYWIRPTLVHGTAADLRDLARSLAAAERRWRLFGTRERRFRRLRAAVLWGSDPLDPETEEFYASLGARVVRPATFSRQ
jgi:hypothetical protein